MARLRGEGSFNEPEAWFLATFFGGIAGLAYMLVTSIVDWFHGVTLKRYRNG